MQKGLFKRYIGILAKSLTWLLLSIIALILLIIVLIQIPAIQNFAKDKAVVYLESKLKTKVTIGNLSIIFPKQIVLEKVYFEDQHKDTLLFSNRLKLNIAIFKLFKDTVAISAIELEGVHLNLSRNKPNSFFNYDYIIKAFSSDTPKKKVAKDSTAPLQFKMGSIILKDIQLRFKDDASGIDSRFVIGNFKTRINTFNPDLNTYEVSDILVNGLIVRLKLKEAVSQTISPTLNKDTSQKEVKALEQKSSMPQIVLGTLTLQNADLLYEDEVSNISSDIIFKELSLKTRKLDLIKLDIPIERISLAGADISVRLDKPVGARSNPVKTTSALANGNTKSSKAIGSVSTNESAPTWKISIAKAAFDSNNISFHNNNEKPTKKGLDYNHIVLEQAGISLDSLLLSPAGYSGLISKLHFSEKSGFKLKELSTKFAYTDKEVKLEKLLFLTERSQIQNKVIIGYPSISSIAKKPGDISLDMVFANSKLAVSDIILLAPMLDKQLFKNRNSVLKINGSVRGYVKDLTIPNFEMSGLGNSSFAVNGTIKGLPKIENTFANVNIRQLKTTRVDIESLVPHNIIPANIRIPNQLSATGIFNGTLNDFNTKIKLITSDGNASVVASMKDKGALYDAEISTDSLNFGSILKQDSIVGKISLSAIAKGSGFDYKTMNVQMSANVIQANIKGYQYHQVLADVKLDKGIAFVNASVKDPNLDVLLDGTANFRNGYPGLKLTMLIDTMNLRELHIIKDSLSFHGKVVADFSNSNPDSLDGSLSISDAKISIGNKSYASDSISVIATNSTFNNSLSIRSEFANMYMKGKYRLTEIGTAFKHSLNKYYQIPGYKDTSFSSQLWNAEMLFHVSPLILRFVPDLFGTEDISAKIHMDSDREKMDLTMNAPLVKYAGQSLNHINVNATTTQDAIQYQVSLERLGNKNVIVNRTSLNGHISKNTLFANLLVKNNAYEKNYQIAGSLSQYKNGFRFQLHPDSLMLNQQLWQVNPENYILYDSLGIYANHFELKNSDQAILINSMGTSASDPLSISFTNFNIKTLTNVIKKDTVSVEGVINGRAIVKNITTHPLFTSDISVDGLTYMQTPLGNLVLKVDNESKDKYTADVSLKGLGTKLSLNGYYQSADKVFDLNLLVDSLDIASIKPFSFNQLKDAGGNLNAKIKILGTLDQPKVDGVLNFDKAYITSTMLGEKFSLNKEQVKISDNNIHFKSFTLSDSIGNKAVLNGDILTNDYQHFNFAIKLNADDFNLINSTKADNQLFYGKLNMDADININGSLEAPIITANLKANKNTDLVFVLPSSDPEVQSREGVVNFIDARHMDDSVKQINLKDTLAKFTSAIGMNLSSVIETDTGAIFTMIIDSRTGDAINIKGKSSLNAGLDESGKLSLTGMYEVQTGSYQVSFNVLKKKFEIVKGSTINWTGDPLSALMNISAKYETKASPIDLVESELGGLTSSEINKYKQRIPVQVFLKMNGELLKPQISFDIIIPEPEASKWQVVDDKLKQLRTDESQMNKQVFAILILGRFVGEDITQNSTGSTTTATMVRQSVGGILSDQLTKAAGGLIKGVDLNIGFESQDDYSTGVQQTRTDMKVGVSKSLNNDRIKVNVGTNVALEGAPSNSNASKISGDVSIDYLITKDGRYMIRTYSKNNYEGVIEGDIVESGVTFIFTVEYEKFSDLFHKKGKIDSKKKQQKTGSQK